MDRKNISSASWWVAGFLGNGSYMHVPNDRVNICSCLVPDETVHFQQNLQKLFLK